MYEMLADFWRWWENATPEGRAPYEDTGHDYGRKLYGGVTDSAWAVRLDSSSTQRRYTAWPAGIDEPAQSRKLGMASYPLLVDLQQRMEVQARRWAAASDTAKLPE